MGKISDYTVGTAKGGDMLTVSDADTLETKNLTLDDVLNAGAIDSTWTLTEVTISAADLLANYENGIEILPEPDTGKYYNWYAIVEKNDDGYFNIPATDKIYVGTSDYRSGTLIGDLGYANNNSNKIVAHAQPNPINVSSSLALSSFCGIGSSLIIASWYGETPNDVTCTITVKVYHKQL